MDADTIPTPRGVEGCLRAFQHDPKLVAAGGVIQTISAKGLLTTFQSLEYLRTFLCERLGWSILGSTTLISGAFCMVRKEAWKKIGGFRNDSITEDLDLIVRLRKAYPGQLNRFRILPITTCHTQVPKDLKHLMVQRMRWQLGLVDTLARNIDICFNPAHGILGLVAIPYSWIVEVFSPLLEFTALIVIPYAIFQGWIDPSLVLFYLCAGLFFNVIITLFGVYLDNRYVSRNKSWSCLKSTFHTIILHLGYKQLTSWWRLLALFRSLGKKHDWGEKPRQEIAPQTL
jgi:cellulose synthase/poly-beta-1,6-N-acetylglucosamine synthase-like glycosyltransferase